LGIFPFFRSGPVAVGISGLTRRTKDVRMQDRNGFIYVSMSSARHTGLITEVIELLGDKGFVYAGEPKKSKPEVDEKQVDLEDEIVHWLQLLERLGQEGSEDARQLVNDIKQAWASGEDQETTAQRFVAGLLRYSVVQAYERPVIPGTMENFSMRLPASLLEKLDTAVAVGTAATRSELVRTLIEIAFATVDASQMQHRAALIEVMALMLRRPEEMLLFYLIRSFFERDDVASVGRVLASVAGPLSEIIATIGGQGIERVKEYVNRLLEASMTAECLKRE